MLWFIFFVLLFLFIYHHLIYPKLLKYLFSKEKDIIKNNKIKEKYLPNIGVFIAAYNEEKHIEEKLNNLICQTYPFYKIGIHILNDGSNDKTNWITKKNIKKLKKDLIFCTYEKFETNKGKIKSLNYLIEKYKKEYDIIVFTDVSSLISIDSFYEIANSMEEEKVVSISGKYIPKTSNHDNLNKYWEYQNNIRELEGKIGSVNGFAGAMYAVKSKYVKTLNEDVINDDFVQVINSISKNQYACFNKNISIIENEIDDQKQDLKRRVRISAGNWQQIFIIFSKIKNFNNNQKFSFLSNKVLRGLMPLIVCFLYMILIFKSYQGEIFSQIMLFSALICHAIGFLKKLLKIKKEIKLIDKINYISISYLSGLLGIIMFNKYKNNWLKITTKKNKIKYYKRFIDIIGSITGLIISIPILLISSIAIKLDTKGSVFYKQLRVGELNEKESKLIYIYKLRTMKQDIEEKSGAKWASKNDDRITKVGKFLRKTRIDELPQLWNVLKGDMSLIGPRPERPIFYNNLEKEVPFFVNRTYKIKPGISGLAQVMNGYDNTIEDVKGKIAWDYSYMLSMTKFSSWIRMEIKIIIKTIKVIISKKGQ